MNEIEKKYFDEFVKYTNSKPKISFPFMGDYVYLKINKITNQENAILNIYASIQSNDEQDVIAPIISIHAHPSAIDGYIPDFLIEVQWFYTYKFVIEIDGHEWHEKTKEQASNDRKKDRSYLKNDITPIRFTGTEVFHNPNECVSETLKIIGVRLIGYLLSNHETPKYKIVEE